MEKIELNTGIVLGFEYVAFYQEQTDTTIIVPKYRDVDLILKANRKLTSYGDKHGLSFSFMLHINYDTMVKEIAKGTRREVIL